MKGRAQETGDRRGQVCRWDARWEAGSPMGPGETRREQRWTLGRTRRDAMRAEGCVSDEETHWTAPVA